MRIIQKAVGETPKMALDRLRAEKNIPAETPLSYAGRLDPMASGALVVLEGAECKEQARWHRLDKEYEIEVLLGAHSDTGDVLGLVTRDAGPRASLQQVVASGGWLYGPYRAPYPAFSSRTVGGKALFQWALEERLDEIDVPLQDGFIRSCSVTDLVDMSRDDLALYVGDKLARVPRCDDPRKIRGKNFRVDDVRASWQEFFAGAPGTFQVVRARVICTAGVYMRTLADDLARGAGTRGLALSIHRSHVFIDTLPAA